MLAPLEEGSIALTVETIITVALINQCLPYQAEATKVNTPSARNSFGTVPAH